MAMRAARGFSFLLLVFFALGGAALAAEARRIVTTDNSDYFGFDLRSEQNVSLDQCKTTCLGDTACRAFTYNTKAKWCFLKSDYNQLKSFTGAVAGKVANVDGDPDIGAPPALAFFPNWMADQAQQFRNKLTDPAYDKPTEGLAALQAAAEQASLTGDHRLAMQKYQAAISVLPDDGALWLALAREILAVEPASNTNEPATFPMNATSAAFNAYKLVRTAKTRAEALALLGAGLDKRDLYRPSLQAYEASLALVSSPAVQADYADLKARKGFRVVEHTVDADSSSPRICAQFSEDLVKTGVDYAQFVTVDNAAPKAVEAKDKQICVEGLEHGQHYDVTFRAGLPAAIGET
ncbi:hypothetical protein EN759_25570, partial [Mesorhizobium sp. M00.F.Ca.ET.038.03.1.1]